MRLESALLLLDELDELSVVLHETVSFTSLCAVLPVALAATVGVLTSSFVLTFTTLLGCTMLATVAASVNEFWRTKTERFRS